MILRRDCLIVGILLLAVLAQASCERQASMPASNNVRYVVGPAWVSADHAWFYPVEQFGGSMTGLAVSQVHHQDGLTANGEARDDSIAEAAVQSLQLPIILTVTNLENGRQILLRANDRGPPSPGRLIALNARAAAMLDVSPGLPTRVRVDIDQRLSQAAVTGLRGSSELAIAAAPQPSVEEQPLDDPSDRRASIRPLHPRGELDAGGSTNVNEILCSQIIRSEPIRPTELWVDIGSFSSQFVAEEVAVSTGGTVSMTDFGPNLTSAVRAGPFGSIDEADAALTRARDGGASGAKIIVK